MTFTNIVSTGASDIEQGYPLDVISTAWASHLVAGSTGHAQRQDHNIMDNKPSVPVPESIFSTVKVDLHRTCIAHGSSSQRYF